MNDPLLSLLTCLVVLLLALGGAGAILRQAAANWSYPAASALTAAAGVTGAASLILGKQPAFLQLPAMLPLQLRLDPAAAFCVFALLPLCAAPLLSQPAKRRMTALPAGTAGLFLAALAGNAATCALGAAIAASAAWREARPSLRVCLASAVTPLLVAALARSISPGIPSALGVLLALGGIALSMAAALSAVRRDTLDAIVVCAICQQGGLALAAIGIAMLAQACDRPDAAALALGGAMLLALAQSLHGTMGALATDRIDTAAATRRLDRLGGLIHRMPATTAALTVGLLPPTALPPCAGFAGLWITFQAAVAITRSGDLLVQVTLILAVAWMGLGAALGTAVLVRAVGVACLGRPRTPRSAVAAGARPDRVVFGALAAAAALAGLFPGPLLRLACSPAIHAATGVNLSKNAGWLLLTPGNGQPGYAPLAIGLIAAAAWGGLFWLFRRQPQPATRPAPVWQDGFAAPPPWLPFGDPLTQTGSNGFAPRLSPMPPWRGLFPPRLRPPSPALAVALLIALIAGGGLALRWAVSP